MSTRLKDRAGRFRIDSGLIDRAPKAMLAVLKDVIVVRAEAVYWGGFIEYTGLCDAFEFVSIGDEIPRHVAEIKDLTGGKYHVAWRRTTEVW